MKNFYWLAGVLLFIFIAFTFIWNQVDKGSTQSSQEVSPSVQVSSNADISQGQELIPELAHTSVKDELSLLDDIILDRISGSIEPPAVTPHEESLAQIIDLSAESLNSQERVAILRNLSGLNEEEVRTLIDFVKSGQIPEVMDEEHYYWLVDEIYTATRDSQQHSLLLSEELSDIAGNTNLLHVVRDYALQHLGHLTHEGGDRELIKGRLLDSLSVKDGSLAGTALLAARNGQGSKEWFKEQAEQIAQDERYSKTSRITAIQVASENASEDFAIYLIELSETLDPKTGFGLVVENALKNLK